MNSSTRTLVDLPLLPLRDFTLLPGVETSLLVGRLGSRSALASAMETDKRIFAITRRDMNSEANSIDSFYKVGTVAEIQEQLVLPDGIVKVLISGRRLGALLGLQPSKNDHVLATVELLPETGDPKLHDMGFLPRPIPKVDRPDDVVESIFIDGFDAEGRPEIRRERSGSLWLVFNQMPPSWVPEEEYAGFGRCGRIDRELEESLGCQVLWDDREFFFIEHPQPDSVERIKSFLSDFRRRNMPAA